MKFLRKIFIKKATTKDTEKLGYNFEKSIEDYMNREKYQNMSEDELRNIDDDKLLQSIFDYICDEHIKDNWTESYKIVKELPIGFQHIFGLWILEAEVNNGGFNQYFYNNGQFVDESYNGCIAIGANRMAELVEKAINTIMDEKEMQLEMRKKGTLEAFSESYKESKLGECDKEFYKYLENMQDLQIKYIRNNYNDFHLTTTST